MTAKRIFLFCISAGIFLSAWGMMSYAQLPEREKAAKAYSQDVWQDSVDDLRLYVNGLVQENQRLTAAKEELEKRISALEKSTPELPEKQECPSGEGKGSNQSLKKEIDALKRDKVALKNKIDLLKKQEQSPAHEALSEAQKKIKQQQKEVASLAQVKAENARLTDQLANLKNELNLKDREVENLKRVKAEAARQQEISESLLQIQLKRSLEPGTDSLTPKKVRHEALGYDLAAKGRYAQAVEEYQKSLEENPNHKDSYFNLGSLYSKLKNYSQAADNYEKVLTLDPNDKEALYNLSKIYEKLSNPTKAKYYYDLYLEQDKR